jgi:hypothetical protein
MNAFNICKLLMTNFKMNAFNILLTVSISLNQQLAIQAKLKILFLDQIFFTAF